MSPKKKSEPKTEEPYQRSDFLRDLKKASDTWELWCDWEWEG